MMTTRTAIASAIALSASMAFSTAQANDFDYYADVRLGQSDISGFSDDATYLSVTGGYNFDDRVSVYGEVGATIADAEGTRRTGFGSSVDIEGEYTLFGAGLESSDTFGRSDFGYSVRLGVARIDSEVTASSGGASASESDDTTNLVWGAGVFYQLMREHRLFVDVNSHDSDIASLTGGYRFSF